MSEEEMIRKMHEAVDVLNNQVGELLHEFSVNGVGSEFGVNQNISVQTQVFTMYLGYFCAVTVKPEGRDEYLTLCNNAIKESMEIFINNGTAAKVQERIRNGEDAI